MRPFTVALLLLTLCPLFSECKKQRNDPRLPVNVLPKAQEEDYKDRELPAWTPPPPSAFFDHYEDQDKYDEEHDLPDPSTQGPRDNTLPEVNQTPENTLPGSVTPTEANTLPSAPAVDASRVLPSEVGPGFRVPQTPEETRCWYCASVVAHIADGNQKLRGWCSLQGVNAGFCAWMVQMVGTRWDSFMLNIRDQADFTYRVIDFRNHVAAICKAQCKGVRPSGPSPQ